jgi:flagellar hook-length control protein FliK
VACRLQNTTPSVPLLPLAMPALVVANTPPAIASTPNGAPAPVADAGTEPVSFDSVLAAALAEPTVIPTEPVAVSGTENDAPQSEDGAANNVQSGELLVLDIAVAAPVPSQAAIQLPVTSAPAVPLEIDALAARPGRAQPSADLPTIPAPAEIPSTLLSAADPGVQLPDPAKIAAPTASPNVHEVPELASAQPAAVEPAARPDSAPLHAAPVDATVSVVPVASERAEPGARPPALQPVRLEVAAPVGSREFGAEVGNRLVWMATNHQQVAELRIDPPQLGPVEVRMSIANDQASLSISSPHAAVRDAIQASLPRLQDMLQGLGISLGSVSVGAEGFGQGNLHHSSHAQGWSHGEHALPGEAYPLQAAANPILPLRVGAGVIDVYA